MSLSVVTCPLCGAWLPLNTDNLLGTMDSVEVYSVKHGACPRLRVYIKEAE